MCKPEPSGGLQSPASLYWPPVPFPLQAFALPGPRPDYPQTFPPMIPSSSSDRSSDKLSWLPIKSPLPSLVYSLQRLLPFHLFVYLSACLLLSLPLERWLQERGNLSIHLRLVLPTPSTELSKYLLNDWLLPWTSLSQTLCSLLKGGISGLEGVLILNLSKCCKLSSYSSGPVRFPVWGSERGEVTQGHQQKATRWEANQDGLLCSPSTFLSSLSSELKGKLKAKAHSFVHSFVQNVGSCTYLLSHWHYYLLFFF